jgi:sigma-E factor negative regulatory protein RseA
MTKQEMGARARSSGCTEAMSQLIDGELDESACRELCAQLARDPDARREWMLLNMACDAVRSSETAAFHSAAFVARMSAALADEPPILAPRALRRRRSVIRRIVLPGAAVAAAAVVLAVVAVPQLRGGGSQGGGQVVRSGELEAYLEAHRDRATGPLAPRATDYLPAAFTTEQR